MTTHRKASSSERQDEQVASHQRAVGFIRFVFFSLPFGDRWLPIAIKFLTGKCRYYSRDDALRLPGIKKKATTKQFQRQSIHVYLGGGSSGTISRELRTNKRMKRKLDRLWIVWGGEPLLTRLPCPLLIQQPTIWMGGRDGGILATFQTCHFEPQVNLTLIRRRRVIWLISLLFSRPALSFHKVFFCIFDGRFLIVRPSVSIPAP